MKKILFLSHDANRAGAPILLLNLAKLLKDYKSREYSISFLIKRPPYIILENFLAYKTDLASVKKAPLNKIINKLSFKWNFLKKVLPAQYSEKRIIRALHDTDIVISNTITNGDILPLIRKNFNGPIISYIHELSSATKLFTTKESIDALMSATSVFMVPSMAVKYFLMDCFHINKDDISLLPYYIPEIENLFVQQKKHSFKIGAAGLMEWRKGYDLFILVAIRIFKHYPDADIQFIWQGAQEGLELDRLQDDIKKANLENKIKFLPPSSEMTCFYQSLDIFLLTSREDPYPLVVLEAANASVPVICFKNAGGSPEFIEKSNGGICVDYLDLEAMGNAVIHYYNNNSEREKAGSNAKKRLKVMHQNPEFIINLFESIIGKTAYKA